MGESRPTPDVWIGAPQAKVPPDLMALLVPFLDQVMADTVDPKERPEVLRWLADDDARCPAETGGPLTFRWIAETLGYGREWLARLIVDTAARRAVDKEPAATRWCSFHKRPHYTTQFPGDWRLCARACHEIGAGRLAPRGEPARADLSSGDSAAGQAGEALSAA